MTTEQKISMLPEEEEYLETTRDFLQFPVIQLLVLKARRKLTLEKHNVWIRCYENCIQATSHCHSRLFEGSILKDALEDLIQKALIALNAEKQLYIHTIEHRAVTF